MINYQRLHKLKLQSKEREEQLSAELERVKAEHGKVLRVLEGTLHEVKRFSSEISARADQLQTKFGDRSEVGDLSATIFYTSGMLAARLSLTDLELNPAMVAQLARVHSGIYKKFEKARHILALKAQTKGIAVRFKGNSFYTAELFQAFELVPFILLENAIKYSPRNEEVAVHFVDAGESLAVQLRSIGPQVGVDEIKRLPERGFRGSNASRCGVAGDGLGLHLVSFLCGLHDVELSFASESEQVYAVNGVPYSWFAATLSFVR